MKKILAGCFALMLTCAIVTELSASWYCCGEGPCTWVEDGSADDVIIE